MLESRGVQSVRLDSKQVAGSARHEHGSGRARWAIGLERLAKLRDEAVHRSRCRLRRPFPPELVDQAVARNHLVRTDEQRDEQRTVAAGANRDLTPVSPYLKGAEDSELEGGRPVVRAAKLALLRRRENVL